jgi:hypothetical protein
MMFMAAARAAATSGVGEGIGLGLGELVGAAVPPHPTNITAAAPDSKAWMNFDVGGFDATFGVGRYGLVSMLVEPGFR